MGFADHILVGAIDADLGFGLVFIFIFISWFEFRVGTEEPDAMPAPLVGLVMMGRDSSRDTDIDGLSGTRLWRQPFRVCGGRDLGFRGTN